MRTVVRFDRLLTELHRADSSTADGRATATLCGEPIPPDNSVVWIDWPDDGTPHCPDCYGTAVAEEGLFA